MRPTCRRVLVSLPIVTLLASAACAAVPCESVEPADEGGLADWIPDESLESIAEAQAYEVDPLPVDPYAELSEEQRTEQARVAFGQAEAFAKQGQWLEAKTKYEEAYHLVPSKHGLAYKVANAAVEAGDCEKARVFFEHYLLYGDINRHQAQLHSALAKHRALECTL